MGALLAAPVWLRIGCIVFSLIIIALGIGVCCALTVDAGVYECPSCGEKFVPTMKDFICGAHTFTKRKIAMPQMRQKELLQEKVKIESVSVLRRRRRFRVLRGCAATVKLNSKTFRGARRRFL